MRSIPTLAVVAVLALSTLGAAHASTSFTIHLLTNPTSPRGEQHCEQLTVPGGKGSKFWADEGWRYNVWVASTCPAYFNYVNAKSTNLDGFPGVTYVKFGVHTTAQAADADAGTMMLHFVTGANDQHCSELKVHGGKTSAFWTQQGYRFDTWTAGACSPKYNWVNKVEHGYMGYRVEFETKGVHDAKHTVADADAADVNTDTMTLHFVTGANDQHCSELKVHGGKTSAFWTQQGYRFDTWTAGACSPKYNWVNKVEHGYMGYGVEFETKGIHDAHHGEAATDPDYTMRVHLETQEHCSELEVRGGTRSEFWRRKGDQFSTWTAGACPRQFNWLNKEERRFMGYRRVTYLVLGINTKEHTHVVSRLRGSN